jgi:predicted outer membrane lipoprotein
MFFVLLGFVLATVFAVVKARDLKQMEATQTQLIKAYQDATNEPLPPDIKLLDTKKVILNHTRAEAFLVAGFVVTAGLTIWNALSPFVRSL